MTAKKKGPTRPTANVAKYPRHSVTKALRVPRAILEQNAGKACTDREAAEFVGVGFNGPFSVELSSAIKYGLLSRPQAGKVAVTDLAKRILRPQGPADEIAGFREAVVRAPELGDVYQHYRGENLPDPKFLANALTDKFAIPSEKVPEFVEILFESLKAAQLVEEHGGKTRIIDVLQQGIPEQSTDSSLKKLARTAKIEVGDSCFVIMPFAAPIGAYFTSIHEVAIRRAGLTPVRADADIFGTGKVIDQIWSGINAAKVLVAELTTRNPNVYYELGLAHALEKPVVLVCSNEQDVPFDLQHIRVIYYDVTDPFWGDKLIAKIAENILSALTNPEEAVFRRRPQAA